MTRIGSVKRSSKRLCTRTTSTTSGAVCPALPSEVWVMIFSFMLRNRYTSCLRLLMCGTITYDAACISLRSQRPALLLCKKRLRKRFTSGYGSYPEPFLSAICRIGDDYLDNIVHCVQEDVSVDNRSHSWKHHGIILLGSSGREVIKNRSGGQSRKPTESAAAGEPLGNFVEFYTSSSLPIEYGCEPLRARKHGDVKLEGHLKKLVREYATFRICVMDKQGDGLKTSGYTLWTILKCMSYTHGNMDDVLVMPPLRKRNYEQCRAAAVCRISNTALGVQIVNGKQVSAVVARICTVGGNNRVLVYRESVRGKLAVDETVKRNAVTKTLHEVLLMVQRHMRETPLRDVDCLVAEFYGQQAQTESSCGVRRQRPSMLSVSDIAPQCGCGRKAKYSYNKNTELFFWSCVNYQKLSWCRFASSVRSWEHSSIISEDSRLMYRLRGRVTRNGTLGKRFTNCCLCHQPIDVKWRNIVVMYSETEDGSVHEALLVCRECRGDIQGRMGYCIQAPGGEEIDLSRFVMKKYKRMPKSDLPLYGISLCGFTLKQPGGGAPVES